MNIVEMGEKLLESSVLLERWEQWAKQYGSLINENGFNKLKAETEAFFKVNSNK